MSAPGFHWKSSCPSVALIPSVTAFVVILALLLPVASHSQSCLPEGITFTTQSQIDSFPINYPGCTEIEGIVIISGDDITNLDGLNSVTIIWGELFIGGWGDFGAFPCPNLTDLYGLQSLTWTLSLYVVGCHSLKTLEGLENLTYVDFSLCIGVWGFAEMGNDSLLSLTGIDNIDNEYLPSFMIANNPVLSTCEVYSVCNYLLNYNGSVLPWMNANGCNSVNEIEDACTVGIAERQSETQLSAYPNPFTTAITIDYELTEPSHILLTIYNSIGAEIYRAEDRMMSEGKHSFAWSADQLPEGLYYAVLRSGEGVSVVKMIKE